MDIVIRNGIIDTNEAKRIKEIKNNAGLLKKDYKDFLNEVPGPYYDFFDSHICVPRKYDKITNFIGPQHKKKIKLIETKDFNKLTKYCCICHSEIIPKTSFPSKRKILIDVDYFVRKKNPGCDLYKELKKMKIDNNNNIDLLTSKFKKSNININTKWINLYNKFNKNINLDNLKLSFENYKKTQLKIINNYYKIVYKLIKSPVLYPISITETKLIWPWDLTDYQKFKLNNHNYKLNPIFNHYKKNKITTNYVVIE